MALLYRVSTRYTCPRNLNRAAPWNTNFITRLSSTTKSIPYYLGRNAPETTRLNRQHNILKKFIPLLHPIIQSSLPPSPKIADFATGTAIWPLEVSTLLPTAEIDGFDISDVQFPSRELWPGNVKLSLRDVLDKGHWEGEGKYDMINVRALVSVLGDREWEIVLGNLVRGLKPGGWIQWVDLDLSPASYKYIPATTDSSSSHDLPYENPLSRGMKLFHECWSTHLNHNLATCTTLPSLFANNGLNYISHTLARVKDHRDLQEFTILNAHATSSVLSGWAADIRAERGLKSGDRGKGKMDFTPDEIEDVAREMMRFSREGKFWVNMDLHVVVGRKMMG